MNRLFYFVAVAVAVGLAVLPTPSAGADCGGKNKTHNFYFGNRGYNDRMVFMANPKHDGTFMKKYSTDVVYPIQGHASDGIISYIEVIDQLNNSKGGCAFLSNGGVGQNHFSLHVKSGYRGGGYNFVIKAYVKNHYG